MEKYTAVNGGAPGRATLLSSRMVQPSHKPGPRAFAQVVGPDVSVAAVGDAGDGSLRRHGVRVQETGVTASTAASLEAVAEAAEGARVVAKL